MNRFPCLAVVVIVGCAACSTQELRTGETITITVADAFLDFPAIEVACKKVGTTNIPVKMAVGNPVYRYLTAFEEIKANNPSSAGRSYYLVEPDTGSASCSASFPPTRGIGDVSMKDTQAILIVVGEGFYLMELSPRRRVHVSRLGEMQANGEPLRDTRASVPIHVRKSTFTKSVVRLEIEVLN